MGKDSRLAISLEILQWTPERLAREINRRYGDGTVSLKAPYGWIKGAYPRGRVPGFVATILSESLGRVVEIRHIWPQRFPETESTGNDGDLRLSPPWSEEHVDRILRPLVEQDDEEQLQAPFLVPGAGLVLLAVDWLTAEGRPASARTEGAELDPEMIDMLFGRIARLRRLGDAQNSALVLNWVVHELRWARHLTTNASFDAPTARRLYGAIAELAQLAGWLAADHGKRAQGQQYLIAGLRASSLAGDPNLGAYILSCLSHHLMRGGNGLDALRLIRLADAGADASAPTVLRSLLASHEARAHAQLGDEAACRRLSAKAAALFDASGAETDPSWAIGPKRHLAAGAGRAQLAQRRNKAPYVYPSQKRVSA